MNRILAFSVVLGLVCGNVHAQIVKDGYTNQLDFEHAHGFLDVDGNWVVQPQYARTYWYKDWELGTFQYSGDETEGLLDKWGKVLVPQGKYISYFKDKAGLLIVKNKSEKKGVVTMAGEELVPCKYDDIYIPESKAYMQVKEGELIGLLKFDGTAWVPCAYSNIFVPSSKGYIEVTDKEGNVGLLHLEDGSNWVPCAYSKIYVPNSKEYIQVTDKGGMVGVLKFDGTELIPCKYKSTIYWKEYNYIQVGDENKKEGVYSLEGDIIAPCVYDNVKYATEGLVLVNKGGREENYKFVGGKWGYCAGGKEIIPCIYDEATEFKNDVATVKKDGEVKLIKNPLKDGSQIQIAGNTSPLNKKDLGGPAVSRYPAPNSDVDKNIPVAKQQAETTFAFIIANENYPDAPVPYSLNDGRMFREYCQQALGLPAQNINLYEDATFGTIITAVEKMKQVADAYDGEASVIFYYAGHGFPDEKQQSAYLLPIDGNASDITTTGYSLAKLYKEIAALKLRSAVVLLDACFSGAKREDQMLASSRGVAIRVKDEAPQGNMIVFSAAQGDETAHQLEEKGHGLFTYYLLKELQATGGDVDMGTLTDYVTKQVKRQSVVINNKKQTPTVIPSASLAGSWQSVKLR